MENQKDQKGNSASGVVGLIQLVVAVWLIVYCIKILMR